MLNKFLTIFLLALVFWAGVDIVMSLFSLGKMETGSFEWWVACGVIGMASVEIVEYFIERKNKKKD